MAIDPILDLRPGSPTVDIAHAPANIEAEQSLLGILLYDNGAYERLSDSLQASHFFEPFHGRLYAAIQGYARRGHLAEPILLAEQFQRDPAFEELGGVRYLADMVDRAPPAADIRRSAATFALVATASARSARIRGRAMCVRSAGTSSSLRKRGRANSGRLGTPSCDEAPAARLRRSPL